MVSGVGYLGGVVWCDVMGGHHVHVDGWVGGHMPMRVGWSPWRPGRRGKP